MRTPRRPQSTQTPALQPTLYTPPGLLGAASQRCLSSRAEGAEGSHAPGAAGPSEAPLCLLQPRVTQSGGTAGQGGRRLRPLLAHSCSVQAAARGVLQPGSQPPALPPRGCWSSGGASPGLPAHSPSGALPPAPTSRPDYHLPLGTEASVQPREEAGLHSDVWRSTPGPTLKGWW